MTARRSILALLVVLLPMPGHAAETTTCPTTVASQEFRGPVDASPGTQWYGTDALAVMLPTDGIWPTTKAGNLIAVKLFWWSEGFEPGMENALHVELTDLAAPDAHPKTLAATNAKAKSLGGWAMLTGIDLPHAGCWRISARYHREELSFVIQAIDAEAYIAREMSRS